MDPTTAARTIASIAMLGALAAAQEPSTRRFQTSLYAVDLPTSWRTMSPEEAVRLRDGLPTDMQHVLPGRITILGDVDAWLASGFDGKALVVIVEDHSTRPVDAGYLDEVRRHWREYRPENGDRRHVLDARLARVGPAAHPAAIVTSRAEQGNGGRALTVREIYASTSGRQVILSLRSQEDDAEAAAPVFGTIVDSITFARPQGDADELSRRLVMAAFVGALVGLMFLVVRKTRDA
jgi:hypothetical protein